eukprot:gnl/TRDRNA2_/TRDRNA2_176303_c0_seq3.p1 gnl/TRDRNA2_/TRDRNA2_176303_c0~~gnl/TRDRNA2_/TRDRNA2_176303_c0_seq3.p1  ORF type:complete len:561 (+),score=50.92 gnl/TRDRNA2_/TRDRNA2_176303_c0_seq3:78-1760(+)
MVRSKPLGFLLLSCVVEGFQHCDHEAPADANSTESISDAVSHIRLKVHHNDLHGSSSAPGPSWSYQEMSGQCSIANLSTFKNAFNEDCTPFNGTQITAAPSEGFEGIQLTLRFTVPNGIQKGVEYKFGYLNSYNGGDPVFNQAYVSFKETKGHWGIVWNERTSSITYWRQSPTWLWDSNFATYMLGGDCVVTVYRGNKGEEGYADFIKMWRSCRKDGMQPEEIHEETGSSWHGEGWKSEFIAFPNKLEPAAYTSSNLSSPAGTIMATNSFTKSDTAVVMYQGNGLGRSYNVLAAHRKLLANKGSICLNATTLASPTITTTTATTTTMNKTVQQVPCGDCDVGDDDCAANCPKGAREGRRGSGFCFTSNAMVLTRLGPKSMGSVRLGDELLGFNHFTGLAEFTKVRAWLHRAEGAVISLTRLHTDVGVVESSEMHSLAVGSGYAFAQDIAVGNALLTPNGTARVNGVSSGTGHGAFAPLTFTSNFYVSSPGEGARKEPPEMFLAHSFSGWRHPRQVEGAIHLFLTFAEFFSSSISDIDDSAGTSYIHPVCRLLAWVAGVAF